MALSLLPFLLLFAYNNYVLIPRFLLPGKLKLYLGGVLIGMAVILLWQYADFMMHKTAMPPRFLSGDAPVHHPRRLFPLPLLLDAIYDALVIGGTTAIALIVQRVNDRIFQEQLLKATAQSELAYLRAQINPHFYMNMLNNIHGMIEIDPPGAQQMVLDMSHLMRYMLYDSIRPYTPLYKEIDFIRTYLNIMRKRFPGARVDINAKFPDERGLKMLSLPSLLLLGFIENAFKHGISYRHPSFVSIEIELRAITLIFKVTNSKAPDRKKSDGHEGIGLANIRQRLNLIYGRLAFLDIHETADTYQVELEIPLHGTDNDCN